MDEGKKTIKLFTPKGDPDEEYKIPQRPTEKRREAVRDKRDKALLTRLKAMMAKEQHGDEEEPFEPSANVIRVGQDTARTTRRLGVSREPRASEVATCMCGKARTSSARWGQKWCSSR